MSEYVYQFGGKDASEAEVRSIIGGDELESVKRSMSIEPDGRSRAYPVSIGFDVKELVITKKSRL